MGDGGGRPTPLDKWSIQFDIMECQGCMQQHHRNAATNGLVQRSLAGQGGSRIRRYVLVYFTPNSLSLFIFAPPILLSKALV